MLHELNANVMNEWVDQSKFSVLDGLFLEDASASCERVLTADSSAEEATSREVFTAQEKAYPKVIGRALARVQTAPQALRRAEFACPGKIIRWRTPTHWLVVDRQVEVASVIQYCTRWNYGLAIIDTTRCSFTDWMLTLQQVLLFHVSSESWVLYLGPGAYINNFANLSLRPWRKSHLWTGSVSTIHGKHRSLHGATQCARIENAGIGKTDCCDQRIEQLGLCFVFNHCKP